MGRRQGVFADQDLRKDSRPLLIDFFPRESHLVSFKDPYSFPILYNPSCEAVAMPHLDALAQKV